MEPNSPENLLQDVVFDNVTLYSNTQRSLTLSAHGLQEGANFEPISITVRNSRIIGGTMGEPLLDLEAWLLFSCYST